MEVLSAVIVIMLQNSDTIFPNTLRQDMSVWRALFVTSVWKSVPPESLIGGIYRDTQKS